MAKEISKEMYYGIAQRLYTVDAAINELNIQKRDIENRISILRDQKESLRSFLIKYGHHTYDAYEYDEPEEQDMAAGMEENNGC